MSVIQGPFVTGPSPVLSAVSKPPQEQLSPRSHQIQELAALLGPLVSPLLQSPRGSLDLSKIPSVQFDSFRSFLITQVKIDGIAFNDSLLASYHQVLSQERYTPLLKSLFNAAGQNSLPDSDPKLRVPRTGNPQPSTRGPGKAGSTPAGVSAQSLGPRGSDQDDLLQSFTADLIAVSPERFASHHLQSPEGWKRLKKILQEPKAYSSGLRTDLVKGIALAGRRMGTSRQLYRKLNEEISVWNYSNTAVTKEELQRATHLALEILGEVAGLENEAQDSFEKYLKHPGRVNRLVGLEKKLQRTLTNEAIQSKARFVHGNRSNYDPKVALEVRLDDLWLTLIDEDRWKESNSLKSADHIAFMIKEIEAYRDQLLHIKTPSEFIHLAEKVRTFLKGGLGVKGEGTWRAIKDFTAVATVPELFNGLPQVHRRPYHTLLQYVEELHHATDMGEGIELDFKNSTAPGPQANLSELPNFAKNNPSPLNLIPNRRKGSSSRPAGGNIRPPTGGTNFSPRAQGGLASLPNSLGGTKLAEAKTQLILGLQQSKRSLWYQYKQHRALSRGLSQLARTFGAGDIKDIQAGQQVLDDLITQAKACQSAGQIQMIVKKLQSQLQADGKLQRALAAAEVEGTEQLLGLGQTILIIMATRQVGRGALGLTRTLAETGAGGRLHQMAQGLKQLRLTQVIHHGMQNNVFAWRAAKGFALGTWLATAENALALASDEVNPTGPHFKTWAFDALATGTAMGTLTTAASYMGSSLEKNLLKRMMGRYFGSTRARLRILGDAVAETAEEMADATMRARLDDSDAAIGFDQFREIAMVSGLGGFTKTGLIAEMLRSPRRVDRGPSGTPIDPIADDPDSTHRTRKDAHLYLPNQRKKLGPFRVFQRGSLGVFLQEERHGVKIHTAMGYVNRRKKKSQDSQSPLAILISGAGGDHSHFGEWPQELLQEGYVVKNLVLPGYDATDSKDILKVNLKEAPKLGEYWFQSLKQVTESLMEEHPNGPVMLVGHSLGAATVTRIFSELNSERQDRVKGMVLASPAHAIRAFHSPSPVKNWLMRHVAFPFLVMFSPKARPSRVPQYDPNLSGEVFHISKRPWGSEYAAVTYGEAAAKGLSKLSESPHLPPTLILHDHKDPTVAPQGVEWLQAALGNKGIVMNLENTDHYPFLMKGREKLFGRLNLFFHSALKGSQLDLGLRPTWEAPKPDSNAPSDPGAGVDPTLAMMGAGLGTLLSPEIAHAAVDMGQVLGTQGLGSGILTALGVAALGMAFHGRGSETSLYPDLDPLLAELRQDPDNQTTFTQLVHQMAQHPGSWTVMLGLVKKGSYLAAKYLRKVSQYDENVPLRLAYFYTQEMKNIRPHDYKKILLALYLLDGLFEQSKSNPEILDMVTDRNFPLNKFNQLIVDLYVNLIESLENPDLKRRKTFEIYGHVLTEIDFDIKEVFVRTLQRVMNLKELRNLSTMIMVPASQLEIQFSGNARLLDGTNLGEVDYDKTRSFIRENRKNYIKHLSALSIYWVKIYYQNLNLLDSIIYPADRREEFLDDYLETTAITVACEMANNLEKMSDPEEIDFVSNLSIVELYRIIPREWLENTELEQQLLSAVMDHLSRINPPHLDQALDVIEEHFPLDEE